MKTVILNFALFCLHMADSKPAFLQEMHPILCEHNGLTFSPGEDRYVDHEGCKITIVICRPDGKVELAEKYDCSITSTRATQATTTTTIISSTKGPECHYEGVHYRPGEIVYETSHQGLCFGAFCSEEVKIVHFYNVECNSTRDDPTPESPKPEDLPDVGCVVDGMIYDPGEVISRYQQKEMCVEAFCGLNGIEKRETETMCQH